ncbi:MAG: hypothetical protein HY814_05175 [Candidatus Riflebacteria bacterium]|nr:hypothetical protein [Candidatus Riflebacteria bacterium]
MKRSHVSTQMEPRPMFFGEAFRMERLFDLRTRQLIAPVVSLWPSGADAVPVQTRPSPGSTVLTRTAACRLLPLTRCPFADGE